MNLLFQQAALWPALFLVSVPILVHFFARARPKQFPFSSIRFLEKVVRKTSLIQRPKSWLVLILRTLLFAALLLMLLQPFLLRPSALSEPADRRQILLLIDQSASMGVVEGAGTRFSRAVARADEILAGLGPNDLANIIWVRSPAHAEFPVPGLNRGALREALREARPVPEAGDFAGALHIASIQLEAAAGKREIFILSDFQESNWRDLELPELGETGWVLIEAGRENAANQAVTRLFSTQSNPVAGEDFEILAEIANHSDDPVLKRVFLRAGEITASQEIRLAPRTAGTVPFSVRYPDAGTKLVEVSIEEDAFTSDNIRHAVLEVRPYLRVGLLGSDNEMLAIWQRALEAMDWIQAETLTELPAGDGANLPDGILIAGWDGAGWQELQSLQEQGVGLILAPLPQIPAESLAALFALPANEVGELAGEVLQPPLGLRRGRADHPVFEIFADGVFGNPAGGLVGRRLRLPDGLITERNILLSYEDGVPAVAECPGPSSAVIFWNIGMQGEETGQGYWTGREEFVPFLGELLMNIRRESAAGAGSAHEVLAGQRIQQPAPSDILPDEVVLRRGLEEFPAEYLSGPPPVFLSGSSLGPGFYEWVYRSVPSGVTAVNFPPSESDLRPGEPPSAPEGTALVALNSEIPVQELREGRPLWPWLLTFALVCCCLEGLAVWKTRPAA